MPETPTAKAGRSRRRADASLRTTKRRARARWSPPRTGGIRGYAKRLFARALRPYDRHSRQVISGVVTDMRTATVAVADDVDGLRGRVGTLRRRVDRLHNVIEELRSERAAFDTFVTAEMTKEELERHAKRSRFATYLGDNLAVCRVLGNMKMFVDTRDHVLAPHLMMDGYWESWITLAMLRALKPGMVAVDVGANYGYYSILMGRCVGPTGRVVAFEPNPHIATLLRKSLWISGIRQIDEVRQEAAYSTTGETVRFFFTDERPMNGRVSDVAPYDGNLIDVPTTRLDDLFADRVDFIKIDAEGAEREIWRGMAKVIENNPDLQVFMEFNPNRTAFYDPQEFLTTISEDGFEVGVIGYNGRTRVVDPGWLVENGTEQNLHLRRR